MLDDSLFVSNTVQQRTVVLADGTAHPMFFKELPAVKFHLFQLARDSDDDNVKAGSISRLVSESLCAEDGSKVLNYERACQLKSGALSAIFQAVLDVNGIGAKKNSEESETGAGSGT